MSVQTFKAAPVAQGGQSVISLRCPACLHLGALIPIGDAHDVQGPTLSAEDGQGYAAVFGHRRCPRDECLAYILVVYRNTDRRVLASFPAEVVDFDASGLPDEVRDTLEEAIQCHAHNCYRAAAIMVRRTLEAVCAEEGVKGSNLRERLAALGGAVILPQELMDGLDALRLLGNDAAHIESHTYEDVGQEEVELGLDVAKEILKAVYQLGDLVARLNALKRTL